MQSMADDKEIAYFTNANGKKIACRYWVPKGNVRALVFICHGAGEHSGCYSDFAEALIQQDFKVFGHDHIGHGLSEGARVHISSFSQYTKDVFQHVDKVKKEHDGVPCFILGHSMGGCIALRACMEQPDVFKGMILIGPAIIPNPVTATRFKINVAWAISKIIPQCPVAHIDPKYICKDTKIVEKYKNDPLVYHGKLKAKWGIELYWAMKHITDHPEDIRLPMFVIQGSEDKLVEKAGAIFLQDKAASTDKTVQIIEGAYHQIHYEPDGVGEKCIKDVCGWISARC